MKLSITFGVRDGEDYTVYIDHSVDSINIKPNSYIKRYSYDWTDHIVNRETLTSNLTDNVNILFQAFLGFQAILTICPDVDPELVIEILEAINPSGTEDYGLLRRVRLLPVNPIKSESFVRWHLSDKIHHDVLEIILSSVDTKALAQGIIDQDPSFRKTVTGFVFMFDV